MMRCNIGGEQQDVSWYVVFGCLEMLGFGVLSAGPDCRRQRLATLLDAKAP